MKEIYNNVLETIGKTPLIRLNRLTAGLTCTVAAKLESRNPGGSLKDRKNAGKLLVVILPDTGELYLSSRCSKKTHNPLQRQVYTQLMGTNNPFISNSSEL